MADFGPEQYEVVFEADMSGASILPTLTTPSAFAAYLPPRAPRGWSASVKTAEAPRAQLLLCHRRQ
jgi:hypothetical protein